MARSFSEKDFELLGYTDAKRVSDAEAFSIYEAKAPAGLETVPAVFVHLKSSVTNETAKEAGRAFRKNCQNYAVIPKHLESRIHALTEILGSGVRVCIHEDLVWSAVRRTFAAYLTALQEQLPTVAVYVPPRPEKSPHERLDSIAVNWLAARAEHNDEHIMAILANAGIGKTTLSREVTRQLAHVADQHRVIPVYVEASHWARMLDSFEDLWSVIVNSLRHFCPNLQVHRAMFEHLLRSGDLAFVFDGFDELCGHRHASFSARGVLSELEALAATSSARIMLTSRTLYWESEIEHKPSCVRREDLAPFTKQQAFDFFGQRFKGDEKQLGRARLLFEGIRGQNQPPTGGGGRRQISYHPFVVDMIATAVEHGVEGLQQEGESSSEMFSILRSFCVREAHRQQLKTTPDNQLTAFEVLALEADDEFTAEDCAIAGFEEQDLKHLQVHPLVDMGSESTKLRFKYEFLPVLLRARFLVRTIAECGEHGIPIPEKALELMVRESSGRGFIIDHICDLWDRNCRSECMTRAFASVEKKYARVRSFLFHVAKNLVNALNPSLTKKERSGLVFAYLFGAAFQRDQRVDGLHIQGNIDRFDLTGVTFQRCVFEDVVFSECEAGSTTVFKECRFSGELEIIGGNRSNWAATIQEQCDMDITSKLVFEELRLDGQIAPADMAEQVLALALARFWKGGRVQRSIAKVNWSKGPLGRHPLRGAVYESLLRAGVMKEIEIGGVSEGGLAVCMEALGDIQRFMDNRQLSGRLKQAFDHLCRN